MSDTAVPEGSRPSRPNRPAVRLVTTTLAAGVLAGGIALGATSLASAAGSPATSASPAPSAGPGGQAPGRRGGHGRRAHRAFGAAGLVTAVTPDSLTVRTPSGTRTYVLDGATTYVSAGKKTTRDAVKAGEIVAVQAVDPRATPLVAKVVHIPPATLGGFVTGVGAGSFTVTDLGGFTRTVRFTTATTFQKNGAAADASALTGAFVHAIGTVDPDGTTLDATRVVIGVPAPRRAPGDTRPAPAGPAPADAPGAPDAPPPGGDGAGQPA